MTGWVARDDTSSFSVMSEPSPILLFDGTCGFCARSVQFVLARERRRRTLRFASLQSPTGLAARQRHPELASVDSVIWLEPGGSDRGERVLVRSNAALEIMRYLGGGWSALATIGGIVPRFVRDRVYDLIARHRHELDDAASCLLPSPEQRARFIDWESIAGVSG
jgi:predicted DCC family thiol-disulfide oxidoreductase YuxK